MPLNAVTRSRSVFCLALIIVLLFPLSLAILYHADFINVASESLAYRFFYALRTQGVPDPTAWLPQGQLASAMQSAWIVISTPQLPLDADHLRVTMNQFSIASLISFNLIGICTLIAAFRSSLDRAQLGFLAIFVFSITYCIKHNYGMLLWPDYYLLNVNLALAALFLFMKRRLSSDVPNTRETLCAGIFTGLIAANKITMAIVAAPYLLVLFFNCRDAKSKSIFATQIGILTIGTWFLVFLAVGGFHISWLIHVLPHWYDFLIHPGGDEGFGAFTYLFSVYEVAGVILIVGFLGALPTIKTKPDAWLFGGLTIAVLVNTVAVLKRPAGTTMFDMALVEMVFGFAFLTMVQNNKLKSRLAMALAIVAMVDAGLTFPAQRFVNDLKESRARADEQWSFFHTAVEYAGNRPATYYLPENNHQFGDLFIIALKGSSAFPTWALSKGGQVALNPFFPNLQFRFDGSMPAPNDPATTPVVIWIDKIGAAPLSEQYPTLAQVLRGHANSESVPMQHSGTIGHIIDLEKR